MPAKFDHDSFTDEEGKSFQRNFRSKANGDLIHDRGENAEKETSRLRIKRHIDEDEKFIDGQEYEPHLPKVRQRQTSFREKQKHPDYFDEVEVPKGLSSSSPNKVSSLRQNGNHSLINGNREDRWEMEDKLMKELTMLKQKSSQKSELLRQAETRTKLLERKVLELERKVKELEVRDSRSIERLQATMSNLKRPSLSISRDIGIDDESTLGRKSDLYSSTSRFLKSSQVGEQYLRSLSSSLKKRPPFINAGTSLQTMNHSIPFPVSDRTALKIKRLQDQKQLLQNEYYNLLRHSSGKDVSESLDQRLHELLSLIRENEKKIKKLCS